MNLAQLLKIDIANATTVILVGNPEVTTIMSSEKNEPYYLCKLLKPITVRCSSDNKIEPYETDEVYIRESDISKDGWKFVDETKPELGFFMPEWVADFSKSQQIPIYQSETIREWSKGSREQKQIERRNSINAFIREKAAARGNK